MKEAPVYRFRLNKRATRRKSEPTAIKPARLSFEKAARKKAMAPRIHITAIARFEIVVIAMETSKSALDINTAIRSSRTSLFMDRFHLTQCQ